MTTYFTAGQHFGHHNIIGHLLTEQDGSEMVACAIGKFRMER